MSKPDPTVASYRAFKGHLTRTINAAQEVLAHLPDQIHQNVLILAKERHERLETACQRVEESLTPMYMKMTEEDQLKVEEEIGHIMATATRLSMELMSLGSYHASSLQQAESVHFPHRINNSLRPEKLSYDASLSEFRAWKESFLLYFSSNRMDLFPVNKQRGYLRTCIDLKLQQSLSLSATESSTIPDCLELTCAIFLQQTPLITRRYDFFKCNQNINEPFSDWYLRLQLQGNEADLDSFKVDDFYVMRIITGTADKSLRDEFLRRGACTRQELCAIANAWQSASSVERSLSTSTSEVSIAGVSTNRRGHHASLEDLRAQGKCFRCGNLPSKHPNGKMNPCFAQNMKCFKCGIQGHLSSVCFKSQSSPGSQYRGTRQNYNCQDAPRSKTNASFADNEASCQVVQVDSLCSRTPLVTVTIHHSSCEPFSIQALPDTGATEPIIAEDVVYANKIPIKPKRCIIKAANSSGMACSGSVTLEVHAGGFSTTIVAFVTPSIKSALYLSWRNLLDLQIIPKTFPEPVANLHVISTSFKYQAVLRQ